MPTWRSVHLGPLDVSLGLSPSPHFPSGLHARRHPRHAVVSTPFLRLEARLPRRWGELSLAEQDARLRDRW